MALSGYDDVTGNFYLIPTATVGALVAPSSPATSSAAAGLGRTVVSQSTATGSSSPNLFGPGSVIFTTDSFGSLLSSMPLMDGGVGGDLDTNIGGDPGNYNGADNQITANSLISSEGGFDSVHSIQVDLNEVSVAGNTAALNQMVADYEGERTELAASIEASGPASGNVGNGWVQIIEGSLVCFAGAGGSGVGLALLPSTVAAPVAIVAVAAAAVTTYEACFTPAAVTVTPDERAAFKDANDSIGAAVNTIINHFGGITPPGTPPMVTPTSNSFSIKDNGAPSAAIINAAAQGMFIDQQQIAKQTGTVFHYDPSS